VVKYVTDEEFVKLKRIADRETKSLSAIVHQCLAHFLLAHRQADGRTPRA
jgi:hypothetical protein